MADKPCLSLDAEDPSSMPSTSRESVAVGKDGGKGMEGREEGESAAKKS